MSNTKFTLGPWKYTVQPASSYGWYITQDTNNPNDSAFIGEVGGGLQSRGEIFANAKLIAAAPELLRVLFDLSENVKTLEDVRNLPIMKLILSQADEVIKKATE